MTSSVALEKNANRSLLTPWPTLLPCYAFLASTILSAPILSAPQTPAGEQFWQSHPRGEHAYVQYQLNGEELPDGLSVFGARRGRAIESRLANKMTPITDALPVRNGIQTADIVDGQTKTGTRIAGGKFPCMA